MSVSVGVDVGGTFTDVVVRDEVGRMHIGKVLTFRVTGVSRQVRAVRSEHATDTREHRCPLKRANGRDITFTDGRKLFMGSSGTGAPRDGRDPTEPPKKPGGF